MKKLLVNLLILVAAIVALSFAFSNMGLVLVLAGAILISAVFSRAVGPMGDRLN